MRPEIICLVLLGPLPSESEAAVEHPKQVEALLLSMAKPVSDDEARALMRLFGPDGCFGLAWSMLHLIKTARGWQLTDCLTSLSNRGS